MERAVTTFERPTSTSHQQSSHSGEVFRRWAQRDSSPRGSLHAPRLSQWPFRFAEQVIDLIVLTATTGCLFLVLKGSVTVPVRVVLINSFVVAVAAHCVLRALGGYRFEFMRHGVATAAAATGAWLLSTSPALLLVTNQNLSQDVSGWRIIMWCAGALLLFVASRIGLARIGGILEQAGHLGHTVCIVGSGEEARNCAAAVRAGAPGILLLGQFAIEGNDRPTAAEPRSLGLPDRVAQFLQQHRVDELVVATPSDQPEIVPTLLSALQCLPVALSVWPESVRLPVEVGRPGMSRAGLATVTISAAPLHGWRWLLRDLQDRLLAALLLVVCMPVLVLIAAGIKLSSRGPILFRQVREGYCGREFRILKFRTMHVRAENTRLLALTAKNDPRVFRFGALLRRTSLDELPQLLNVLAGDMWLIGPRPHSPLATASGRLYRELVVRYAARHCIKPGITGWAQVTDGAGRPKPWSRLNKGLHTIFSTSITGRRCWTSASCSKR